MKSHRYELKMNENEKLYLLTIVRLNQSHKTIKKYGAAFLMAGGYIEDIKLHICTCACVMCIHIHVMPKPVIIELLNKPQAVRMSL